MDLHYNAFISYRHAALDSAVAQDIQRQLEHFRIPAEIRKKTGVDRIERVFRDQEELPITSNLGEDIARALENADFLIVVCSPSTKESRWVEREVRYFLKTHGRAHVLTAIAEGDPLEVIPGILLRDEELEELEPLSCDYRQGFRKAHRTEIPRLAAPLIGCSYDDLVMRHRQYRMRRILAAMTAAMVLSVAALGYMIWSGARIRDNYRDMQIQQSRYLSAESEELTLKEDRIPAALLALEALPKDGEERPLVPAAAAALIAATDTYQINPEPMNADAVWSFYTRKPVTEYFCDEKGEILIVWDSSPAVYAWSIQNRELLWEKEYREEIRDAFLLEEDSLVVVTGSLIEVLRLRDGTELWKQESEFPEYYYEAAPAGEGEVVLVQLAEDGLCRLVFRDSRTGEVLSTSGAGMEAPLGCSGIEASESGERVFLKLPDYMEQGCRIVVYLRAEDRFTVIDAGQERARDIDYLPVDENTLLLAEHPEGQDYAYSRNGLTQFVDKKAYVSLWREGEGVVWTKEFPFMESGYVTELYLSAYLKAEEPVFLVSAGRDFMVLRSADGEIAEEASLPETAAGCYALKSEEPGFILFLSNGTMLLWNEGTESNLFLRDVFSGDVREVLPFDNGTGNNAYLVHMADGEIRLFESGITDPGFTVSVELEEYDPEVTASYYTGGFLVLRRYNTDLWGWQTESYDPEKGVRTARLLPDRNAGGKLVGFLTDPETGLHRICYLENMESGDVLLAAVDLANGKKEYLTPQGLKPEWGTVRDNQVLLFGREEGGGNAVLRINARTQEQNLLPLQGTEGEFSPVFVSPDGKRAVAAYRTLLEAGCVFLNLEAGTAVPIPELEGRSVSACAFREEGGLFAAGTGTQIAVFGEEQALLYTITPDAGEILFLHFEDGLLAAGGSDGILRFFEAESGNLVKTAEYTSSSVSASSDADGNVRWEKAGDLRLLITEYGADLFDASSWEHLCYVRGLRGFDEERGAFICLKETPAGIGWLHRYNIQELIEKGRQFVLNAEMDAERKARYGLAGE